MVKEMERYVHWTRRCISLDIPSPSTFAERQLYFPARSRLIFNNNRVMLSNMTSSVVCIRGKPSKNQETWVVAGLAWMWQMRVTLLPSWISSGSEGDDDPLTRVKRGGSEVSITRQSNGDKDKKKKRKSETLRKRNQRLVIKVTSKDSSPLKKEKRLYKRQKCCCDCRWRKRTGKVLTVNIQKPWIFKGWVREDGMIGSTR